MIDKISMIRKELDIQNDSSKNIKLKQELATLLAKDNDFEEALNTITESLNLAQKAKLPKEVNKSLRILIKILQIKNDLALSQRIAKEAIRFFNNYSDNSSIILILNHLVQISYHKKNFKYTLKAITELIHIIEKEFPEREKEIIKLIFQKSDIEKELGYYDVSNQTINKAVTLSKEKNDFGNLGQAHYLMGTNFIKMENSDKAMEHFLEAIKLLKEVNNNKLLSDVYLHMAEISVMKNEFAQAMIYFDQSIYLKREDKNLLGIGQARLSLANLFREKKKVSEAIDFYQKAGNLFEVLGAKENLIECYKYLAELYNYLGDQKLAFSYLSKHHKLSSEFIKKQSEEIAGLATKENEIEVLRLNKIIQKKSESLLELNRKVIAFEKEIDSLKQQINNVEDQYTEEKKLLLEAYDDVNKLKTEIVEADLLITEKTSEITDLNKKIKSYEDKINELEEYKNSHSQQIADYENKIDELKNEIENNKFIIEEKNSLIKNDKEKLNNFDSLIIRAKLSEEKLSDELEKLKNELKTKTSDLEKTKLKLSEQKKKYTQLKKENNKLSNKYNKSLETIEKLNEEINYLNALKSNLDNEKDTIIQENNKLKEIIENKNEEIDVSNELLNELENGKLVLENEIEKLKNSQGKEFHDAKNQIRNLSDQIASKEGLIEQLNSRIDKLRLENDKLNEEIKNKDEILLNKQKDFDEKSQVEIEKIKEHYENLLNNLQSEKNSLTKYSNLEIERIQKEKEDLNNKLKNLIEKNKNSINELEQKCILEKNKLKEKYDYSIKHSNLEKDTEIEKLNRKIEEFKIRNQELIAHTDLLAGEISTLRKKLEESKNKFDILNKEKEELYEKNNKDNYEGKIKDLTKSLHKAEAEISHLKIQLKQKNQELNQSQKELKTFQTMIAELQNEQKNKITELEKRNQSKMNENLKNLTDKITTQINIIRSLRESKDNIISERDKLNLELTRQKKRLAATENKLKEFTNSSNNDEFTTGFSPEEYEEIIKERDMTATLLRKSIQAKNDDMLKLKEKIDFYEQQKIKFEEKLNKKIIELEKLKNDNENYKNKFDEINTKLISYEKIVQDYHSQSTETKIKQKKFDDEITSLQNITKNLRDKNKYLSRKLNESDECNKANIDKLNRMLSFSKKTLNSLTKNVALPLKRIVPLIDRLFSEDLNNFQKETYLNDLKKNLANMENFFPKLISERANFAIKQKMNFTYLNVQDLIVRFEPYFKEILDEKKQYWKLVLPKENLIIFGDAIKLFEALFNLVSNASKYSTKGANVLMIVEKIAYSKNQKVCRISVIDNGVGIAQEDLKDIFELSINKRKKNAGEDSAGIGLYVVKAIISKMHGKININSTLNLGTTVAIEFPLQSIN
jgi:signal transduction histidine kinase/TolA-binding protein